MSKTKTPRYVYRIAQVTEDNGQSCIALIDKRPAGEMIVGRFATMAAAQDAYRVAVKALQA